jgi:hypothetical protein
MASSLSSCREKSTSVYGHSGGHCGVSRTFSAMLFKGHVTGYLNPATREGSGRNAKALAELARQAERIAGFIIIILVVVVYFDALLSIFQLSWIDRDPSVVIVELQISMSFHRMTCSSRTSRFKAHFFLFSSKKRTSLLTSSTGTMARSSRLVLLV